MKKDSNIKDFFQVNLFVVLAIDIFLATFIKFIQYKLTKNMNIATAFELGIAAPVIVTKTLQEITGRKDKRKIQ